MNSVAETIDSMGEKAESLMDEAKGHLEEGFDEPQEKIQAKIDAAFTSLP